MGPRPIRKAASWRYTTVTSTMWPAQATRNSSCFAPRAMLISSTASGRAPAQPSLSGCRLLGFVLLAPGATEPFDWTTQVRQRLRQLLGATRAIHRDYTLPTA